MKTKTIYLTIFILSFSFAGQSKDKRNHEAEKKDNPAYIAYELRMNGKADQALNLLEQNLKEDTTNALALYELARTRLHYRSGEMEKKELLDYLKSTIEKAIELDPENIIYYPFAIVIYDMNLDWNKGSGKENEWIKRKFAIFQKMLELNPDKPKIRLGMLETCLDNPDVLHCDKDKLKGLVTEIQETDEVLGAMASNKLNKDIESDYEFWKEMVSKNPNHSDALMEAGDASEEEEGVEYYAKAIRLDPDKAGAACWLLKYFFFSIKEEPEFAEKYVSYAEKIAEAFLAADKYPPLQSYMLACMSRIYNITDNKEKGKEYWDRAERIDTFMIDFPVHPPIELFTSLSQ